MVDKRIDRRILEYMGIYETKNVTEQKKNLGLKIKNDIEKNN